MASLALSMIQNITGVQCGLNVTKVITKPMNFVFLELHHLICTIFGVEDPSGLSD